MSSIFDLPEVQLVDVDPAKIKTDMVTVYEAISGHKLFPGDPVRLFLYAIADVIIQQRVIINDTARQNLLRYARGDMLDQIGALTMTPRLDATPAMTTVRFHLSVPRPSAELIPVGTRVSPGTDIFFATTEVAEIPAGALYVDVPADCLTAGEIGNGYLPGQINVLVDPLPFIARIENTTESSGGSDVEKDDPYRERIYVSPEKFSVAGPTEAYAYWARTANPRISDVMVWSPAPAEVEIRVLMDGGVLPTQDVLDQVADVVNDRSRRPLTDKVTVLAPEAVDYDLTMTYWIDASRATESAQVQSAVQKAIDTYVLWQKARIGRDLMPSELVRLVMNAGARRVEVTSPVYTQVPNTSVAIAANVTVTYGGLESD
ncbi:baseplate J/gp47 family protein [Paenibacillus cisolokensis]|uniref:baseplate assembly protein n=1 Tax=Paenibacillus cisolokensis TaxID=1658519 RepID=UPI003D2CC53D